MTATELLEKVDAVRRLRGWRDSELSRQAGLHKSRLSLWRSGGAPTADTVLAIARALEMDVLDALVLAGQLRPEEVQARTRDVDLQQLDIIELVQLLHRKVAQGKQEVMMRRKQADEASETPLADQADAVALYLLGEDANDASRAS